MLDASAVIRVYPSHVKPTQCLAYMKKKAYTVSFTELFPKKLTLALTIQIQYKYFAIRQIMFKVTQGVAN